MLTIFGTYNSVTLFWPLGIPLTKMGVSLRPPAPEVSGGLRDESRHERRRRRDGGRGRRRGRRGDHAGGRRPVGQRVVAVVAEGLHVELKVQLARHHRVRHLHLELLSPEGSGDITCIWILFLFQSLVNLGFIRRFWIHSARPGAAE